MSDPTREEVERVVAGLTEAQRGVLLHLDPDGGWDHTTYSWPRGEAIHAIGQLERYLTPDGDWLIDSSSAYGSECWRLSDLGRAVAAALRGEGRHTARRGGSIP